MKDIFCKCGHEAGNHYNGDLGCRFCKCRLPMTTVYNLHIAVLNARITELERTQRTTKAVMTAESEKS